MDYNNEIRPSTTTLAPITPLMTTNLINSNGQSQSSFPFQQQPQQPQTDPRQSSELTLEDMDPSFLMGMEDYERYNASQTGTPFPKPDSPQPQLESTQDDTDPSLAEIYELVDAVVPRSDNPNLPVLTFRVILLGGFFCVVLACANTLFTFRTNYFYASPFIGVLISYPLGKFLAAVLPRGLLNPGPFNHKEHALIFVACSSGANTAYALYNIIGQKYQLYQTSLTDLSAVLFAINTQIFGYGLAGLCRRYLVRPAAMLWPSNLSVVAMLNSLHTSQTSAYRLDLESPPLHNTPLPNRHGQTGMSRYRFFWWVTLGAMVWQFVPGYVAPVFTAVSVLCLVGGKTRDPQLFRMLGSANQGLGMGSFSFDWNVITVMSPITTPLWALCNQIVGLWIFVWIVTPLLWTHNFFGIDQKLGADPLQGPNGTSRFPLGQALNTPSLFNLNGTSIPARSFITLPSLTLNETHYNLHAPIYITTYFAMDYACSFAVFTAAIVHVSLWHGSDIWKRFRNALQTDRNDVHAKLMDAYAEVPDWWYTSLLVVNTIAAMFVTQYGGFDLPWWGVLLGLGLAMVSVLPIGVIQAVSGQAIGLNVMSEFMIGLILPGRMAAVMAFKTLSYMSMYQGLALVSDLKLGHYMKIPPRSMFGVQLVTTVVSSILNVFVAKIIYESFGKTCPLPTATLDPTSTTFNLTTTQTSTADCLWKIQTEPPLGWSSTNYNVFLNAGAIWGAIGPARFFGPSSPYFTTLIGFPIGLVLPLIPWALHKLNPTGIWKYINIPLLVAFPGLGAGSTRSEMITPLLVGIIINHVIKKRHHTWWTRYAYVLSAALDSGLSIALTLIFLVFQAGILAKTEEDANRLFPYWWLNRADGEMCASDWWLRCTESRNWGTSWGKQNVYFQVKEIDPFCTGINFRGLNARDRSAAVAAGVLDAASEGDIY
ncbi:hypothetical protein HDU97_004897 [Phlyctochytrium planicorne]|nr:hypothetical protein HDU97_004897 [Phlyctochytrium planicorne]